MDSTSQQLGELLLKTVPTLFVLLVVHLYLKYMFFRPLQAVLQKRSEATEGARQAADDSLKLAAQKAEEYEAKLRDARNAIYRDQEDLRKQWLAEQSKRLDEARNQMHATVHAARTQVQADADEAKRQLESSANSFADQIASSLLERRAH